MWETPAAEQTIKCGVDKLPYPVLLRMSRFGGDDDLKGAVVLFASPAGAYITGQVLAVDGGETA